MARWLLMPSTTSFWPKPPSAHKRRMASATTASSRTSPSTTAPTGRPTWAKRRNSDPPGPAATSAARTAEDPMSRPIFILFRPIPTPFRRAVIFLGTNSPNWARRLGTFTVPISAALAARLEHRSGFAGSPLPRCKPVGGGDRRAGFDMLRRRAGRRQRL